MQRNKRRWIVAVLVAAVLLVPAIIWSGMQQDAARPAQPTMPKGISKMPEVVTVGPEMKPYVMTAAEQSKLSQPISSPLILDDLMRMDAPDAPDVPIRNEGPYPGMTPAELEKLARWRESAQPTQPAPTETTEPVATIEPVPRARGIEGLTPQERAKLEAYLKGRSR
jgi:hypothetical protein